MKTTARERKFLVAGGSVAAASLILYLLVSLLPSRDGLASTVEFKKRMLLRQRETLSREESYKVRLEQYRKRLQQDMTRLLPGSNPNVVGAELQKVVKDLADQSGVEITQRNIQPEKKIQDSLVKIAVRIETNCTLDQLVQFLAAVENYEKFLAVDELTVNSFRVQKRYDIRPGIVVSGYIAAPEAKSGGKSAAGQ